MTAFLALLRESWLTLRAEKLFRVVLGLNIMVIVAYASLGFDKTGFFIFYGLWHFEDDFLQAGSAIATTLFLGIYSGFIVSIWLGWIAAILALISTSSIFPTFLSEGSVELVLSRPPRRSTVFFTKYVGGLLWVALQVSVFTIGAFLAAGWRIGLWDPAIFLAIPLITLFYSFLFCVNVLVGVTTRSTLVALLATIIFWSGTFAIRQADDIVDNEIFKAQYRIEQAERKIDAMHEQRAKAMLTDSYDDTMQIDFELEKLHEQVDRQMESLETIKPWNDSIIILRAIVPETSRTIGLLHRSLKRHSDISLTDLISGKAFEENDEPGFNEQNLEDDDDSARRRRERKRLERATMEYATAREFAVPAWWIITKSLIFEAVILIAAIWIFRRRDF
jgi:ABC-type transport system involved in multi-copper enzyme maturation permease subunit